MTEHESLSRAPSHLRTAAKSGRMLPLLLLSLAFLAIALLTRVVLVAKAFSDGQVAWMNLPGIFAVGSVYDLAALCYLLTPVALYLALIPERIHARAWHRRAITAAFAVAVFALLYLAGVEFFFFDEFNARFNFVAVEYLVYPHEVFVNIWESYPVAKVLAAVAMVTLATVLVLRRRLLAPGPAATLRARLAGAAAMVLAAAAVQAGLTLNTGRYSENRVVNELAANGVYSFFSAAMNSDMDYNAYYLTLPDQEADDRLRNIVKTSHAAYFPDSDHIERHVTGDGPPKALNVVVLLEESFGAEFAGAYGDKRGLTPNFDRLSKAGLLFTRAYATGTRTVRGMEAVSASFPPVPAESIVKRPHNQGMFNWSTVMAKNGYSPTFIYGGFGTFDNMNNFFGSNGYRVIDRTDLDEPKFANIWGVSDEDLFRNAVRVFDGQHARGEKIFSIIMTTSNHKPFTFPPGVPGVAEEGGGRDAGVRYADHAIGRFFEMAEKQPWFGNTLFVIVADHGARVYGREDIPVATYEIPLLFYAPGHVSPGRVDVLTSQIDVAPTVLGLLDFSYDSTFFGIDVLRGVPPHRFIPLNHNRDLALFDGSRLVEIGFRKTSAEYSYDPVTHTQRRVATDPELRKDAITVFQEAYELYSERLYRVAVRD